VLQQLQRVQARARLTGTSAARPQLRWQALHLQQGLAIRLQQELIYQLVPSSRCSSSSSKESLVWLRHCLLLQSNSL
jgi:hypothetical protein